MKNPIVTVFEKTVSDEVVTFEVQLQTVRNSVAVSLAVDGMAHRAQIKPDKAKGWVYMVGEPLASRIAPGYTGAFISDDGIEAVVTEIRRLNAELDDEKWTAFKNNKHSRITVTETTPRRIGETMQVERSDGHSGRYEHGRLGISEYEAARQSFYLAREANRSQFLEVIQPYWRRDEEQDTYYELTVEDFLAIAVQLQPLADQTRSQRELEKQHQEQQEREYREFHSQFIVNSRTEFDHGFGEKRTKGLKASFEYEQQSFDVVIRSIADVGTAIEVNGQEWHLIKEMLPTAVNRLLDEWKMPYTQMVL